MAKKTEVVWFRNKVNGSVQAVPKGSAAQERMVTTVQDDGDGGVETVWEKIDPPKAKSVTYKSGLQPVYHQGPAAKQFGTGVEAEEPAREPEPPKPPEPPKAPEAPKAPEPPKGDGK